MRSSPHASKLPSDSSRSSSFSSKEEASLSKKRNRRKTIRAKRGSGVPGEKVLMPREVPESVSSSRGAELSDPVRSLDIHLMKGAQARSSKGKAKRVQVRFEAHEPSAHVIRLQGMARRISRQVREPKARSIHDWVAPSEAPPSLARMAAEALDLYISNIDVRELYAQFTPFDPEAAYRERRGVWERLRAPFVRWELAWHPVTEEATVPGSQAVDRLGIDERIPEAEVIVPPAEVFIDSSQRELVSPPGYEQQFTTGEHPSRSTRSWSRLRHRLADWLEGAVDGVRAREEEVIEDAEQVLSVPMLVPRVHRTRVFVGFLLLLCVVSLPAGAVSLSRSFSTSVQKTVAVSQEAVQGAKGAWREGGLQTQALAEASSRFALANDELARASGFATAIVQALPKTRDVYRAGRLLLDAGEKATRAAEILAEGVERAWTQPVTHSDERLLALQTHVHAASPLLQEANRAVASVDVHALPLPTRAQVQSLQNSLTQGERALEEVQLLTDLGITAFGHDRPRTYLFLFQNQTELRPTGGFMGSMAEVVFDRGAIRSLRVPGGGPYDLRNQLLTRVRPPEPLQLVSSRWEFQDANWFPDFPTAAKKINWFWSQAGQPTLDGIITINARVLQDLLRITGPIPLDEYGKTFTAENVMLELQKSVELEYDKTENKPKKVIGDLFPRVLERLREVDQAHMLALFQALGGSLRTKDIQIWLRAHEEQATMARFGWDGAFPEVLGDVLALNEANIGGQKTDAVIRERVEHEVQIESDGSIIDTVTLERAHTGEKGELFHGANNVAYVRLYAPSGSELLQAEGFQPPPVSAFKAVLPEDPNDVDVDRIEEQRFIDPSGVRVTEEYDRTAFGGWVQLGPGRTAKTTFRYKLPFNAFDLSERLRASAVVPSEPTLASGRRAAYLLSLTSQSGKSDRDLALRVRVPEGWRLTWSNRTWVHEGATRALASAPWDRDQVVALLFDLPHDEAR